MMFRQAVPVLFDQVVLYKMANYCRPEVAGDVIFGQIVYRFEFVLLAKFGDPSSNRLATIQNAADERTDMLVRRAHLIHCALHAQASDVITVLRVCATLL